METEKPKAILEISTDKPPSPTPANVPTLRVASPKRSPKSPVPSPQRPATPQTPGVLHLGKVSREACTEVEAVRIVVPRAAISRRSHKGPAEGKGESGQLGEDQGSPSMPLVEDWKIQLEKLQNSERRLLQDKEGLCNQLRVNRELKKLLVASVGDDLQYQFERLAREKNQLILENEALGRGLSHTAEQLERMSIQCDVWRSKFLASRVMAEELTNARAALQRQTREAQGAIQDLLLEREEFSREMVQTHSGADSRRTTPVLSLSARVNWPQRITNSLDAIKSHLLGNTSSNAAKGSSTNSEQLCSTPAEKMAEKVLKILDPISHSEGQTETPLSDDSASNFLNNKKSIGRFHPYTRYENITFNCCERCTGDIIVL
ncbi:hypothetical protein NQD34_002110 [Periophthalmus magnuspinnatus]|nr:hypothetical protein NQD34_002110 [Periophthalmus magnuspinnatus]